MTALSSALSTPLPVTERDRLGLTLFLAAALHAIVILGVSIEQFVLKPLRDNLPVMEITLVTRSEEKPPEQADYLAQANQDGGGNTAERVQVITTLPALTPAPQTGVEPAPQPVVEPPPPEPVAKPEPTVPQQQEARPVLTKPEGKKEVKTAPKPAPKPATAPPALPSAAELVSRSLQMASLSAQISDSALAYAQRPRQTFISAKTQEYKYASYMEAWRVKVERIGNLNYPDEAKRGNLTGSLILDVALNPDGSINNMTLRRSSGYKVLDDAALRIVKLAAPYAPFPNDIRKDTDILHITRTWQFLKDNRLASQ
ncbi:MAG: energy transducer TonB [Gammaproteobacteria bacterium]|nr:energy transducer TonB [Gammaproteobacteria bacterium]